LDAPGHIQQLKVLPYNSRYAWIS